MIHIEKSKYTALLRRVLGMRVSNEGVSELEAIFSTIQSSARYAKDSNTKENVEAYVETINFAMELYNLRKQDIWPETPEVVERIPSTEECRV